AQHVFSQGAPVIYRGINKTGKPVPEVVIAPTPAAGFPEHFADSPERAQIVQHALNLFTLPDWVTLKPAGQRMILQSLFEGGNRRVGLTESELEPEPGQGGWGKFLAMNPSDKNSKQTLYDGSVLLTRRSDIGPQSGRYNRLAVVKTALFRF